MKLHQPIAVLGAWIALALSPAARSADGGLTAQVAQTGQIEGRVENMTTGVYLRNARISVEGTKLETLTNAEGEYRIGGVAPGEVRLHVVYTGLEERSVTVTVRANEFARQDISLASSGRAAAEGPATKLDPFIVAVEREKSAQEMALNEQRYAPNIKNVVASDEYADTGEGNIGNFLRNIPGIDIGYSGGLPRTISIRGFPPSGTLVTIDGGEVASSTAAGDGRHVEFDSVKMNNIDRVEITKVPTPDLPANAQGGSVNVISKSGRDLKTPVFSYRVFGTLNSRGMTNTGLATRHVPVNGATSALRPAFDFSYVAPVNNSLAITLGGSTSDAYTKGLYTLATWDLVSLVQASHQVRTLDRLIKKSNAAIGFDWKINRYNTVKVNGQYVAGRFIAGDNLQTATFGAGATGGPSFIQGAATAVGSLSRTHYQLKWNENTTHLTLAHRFDGDVWRIETNAGYSRGVSKWRDIDKGFFQSMVSTLSGVILRGNELGTRPPRYSIPASLSATDRLGNPVDVYDGANYTLGSATSNQWEYTNLKKSALISAKRDFDFGFGLPLTLKVGAAINKQDRDLRKPTDTWAFRPAPATAADRLARNYDVMDPQVSADAQAFYPGHTLQWISTAKAYSLMTQHPEWFVWNPTSRHTTNVNGSKEFAETVTAGFVRGDLKLIDNRLWIVAGVRYERTDVAGLGPLNDIRATFRQDAQGNLILDASGRPIKVTTDALQNAKLQFVERGAKSKRNYDGYFPSLNTTFALTENLLVRAAYAKTIGRPDLNQIIPGVTVADPTSTDANRTLNVVNAGLLPWETNAFDVSVEAYIIKGVTASVGVFQKNIKNFFGSTRTAATAELLSQYGLSDDYIGYDLVTTTNIGTARIQGLEFNYRHSLTFLPPWANGIQVFFNGVFLDLAGPNTANFGAFSPQNLNWGASLTRSRLLLRVAWNHAGERRAGLVLPSATIPAETYDYRAPNTLMNANIEFRLTKNFSLFATAINLTDEAITTVRYAPNTPKYARIRNPVSTGSDFTVGVKGQF